MKKLFKSFYTSIFIFGSILFVFFIIDFYTKGFDQVQIGKSYLPPFTIFYLPIFITFFFKKKDSLKIEILKAPVISFFITYVATYLLFEYITLQKQNNFFNLNLIGLSILSFFTSFFISIILKLYNHIFFKNIKSKYSAVFSWKVIILIPLSASIIYSLIIILLNSPVSNMIPMWLSSFPIGIILSISSFHFFRKINNENRKLKIISFYIISILICVSFWTLSHLLNGNPNRLMKEIVIRLIITSIALFSPYFLYIISITHLYFLQIVSKAENEQLKQQTLESQLNYQQLKKQLSPHFLFNNINVLTSLIEENPTKAVRFSENLSHIYRYFLEQEKQDVVLVKDEVEFAESYLKLLKDRFEVGLNFTITINEKVRGKYIVSTILQQVLENVVKHNTINATNIVDVKITSEENYLIIENNKNPKLKTISESKKGIENIKKRIAFFTDEKVIIVDSETRFIIKLPTLETV